MEGNSDNDNPDSQVVSCIRSRARYCSTPEPEEAKFDDQLLSQQDHGSTFIALDAMIVGLAPIESLENLRAKNFLNRRRRKFVYANKEFWMQDLSKVIEFSDESSL